MAPERQDPAAILDRVPTSPSGYADAPTKRAMFDAFDLRVVYDKAGDRVSISATLTETVASMLHNGLEPLCERPLRASGPTPGTTVSQDYGLTG